jgi:hydrogenase maturation protease
MAAELTGKLPKELVLIGVQPEELEDYGGSLREVVKAQMRPALHVAFKWLERWGAPASIREGAADGITDPALAIEVYEGERPSADQAYRLGDARFLNLEAA